MSENSDHKKYARLFEAYIERQRFAIFAFGFLSLTLILIGVSLILISLLIGDYKQNFSVELIKSGTGSMMAGLSYVPLKEVVERREQIVSYEFMKERLENSEGLPADKIEAILKLAVEMLQKKLTK